MEEDDRGKEHKEAPTKNMLRLWQREDITGAEKDIKGESRSTEARSIPSSGRHPPSTAPSKGSADPKAQKRDEEVSDTPMTRISDFIVQANEGHPPNQEKPAVLKLVPEEDDVAEPTNRAIIEHQNEKRLFKMMSNNQKASPYTRAFGEGSDDDSPPLATRVHYEKQSATNETRSAKSQKANSAKSPMKKLFGIAFSGFHRTSSTEPPTPGVPSSIPPKAQKVLGTTSTSRKKRRASKSKKKEKYDSGSTVSIPPDFVSPTPADIANMPAIDLEKWRLLQDYQPGEEYAHRAVDFDSDSLDMPKPKTPRAPAEQTVRPRDLTDVDYAHHPYEATPTHSPAPSVAPSVPPKDTPLPRRSKTLGDKPEKPTGFEGVGGSNNKSIHQLSQARVRLGNEKKGRLVDKVPRPDSMQAVVYGVSQEYGSPLDRHIQTQDGPMMGGLEDKLPATTFHAPPAEFYTPSVYSRPFMSPRPASTFSPEQNLPHWQSAYNNNVTGLTALNPPQRVSSLYSPHRYPANGAAAGDRLNPFVTPVKQVDRGYDLYNDSPSVASSSPNTSTKTGAAAHSTSMSQSHNAQQDKKNTMREPHQRSGQQDHSEESPPVNDGSRGSVTELENATPGVQQDIPSGGLGITPFLNQQIAEAAAHSQMGSAFPYQSALPSPLHNPMGPPPHPRLGPVGPVLPLAELLTHFHVVHHHLDDIAGGLRDEMLKHRNELKLDADANNDDLQKVINENFGDVRSNLNAIEHEWRRSAGEVEALKSELDKFIKTVSKQLMDPMKELVKQNKELSKQVQALAEHVNKLEKKSDEGSRAAAVVAAATQASTSALDNSGHSIMPMMSAAMQRSDNDEDHGQGRGQQGGRVPGYNWGAYDASRDMSRRMAPQGSRPDNRQTHYGGMNAYYGAGDPSQQQAYADHNYFPTGNGYGYMQH
ncbi:hypothetical protein K490DRAFT_66745 [Saccharata proteae CBS 121410]|uniref:Uncharacterized protein n=1 Tax=Saccharata proteae CBS 121410 TaxID=1314787 RepID=A0A9P4LW06_9PEZI|nr:hypothetical protein K490DRAFT_66745 [Saccharata proteae CBS 121410]